jgi:hypothetical protein
LQIRSNIQKRSEFVGCRLEAVIKKRAGVVGCRLEEVYMVCRLQISEKQAIEEGRVCKLQFRSSRRGLGSVDCRLELIYRRGQSLQVAG